MTVSTPLTPSFLREGGEMGRMMRGFDWSLTTLGPAEDWPGPLKTAVSLLLRARQPMFIGWGRELVSIYNDGYIPICGAKHPLALGQPMSRVWADVWDQLMPMNAAVLRGESLWRPLRIIVMDDNRDAADTLSILLQAFGHESEVAYGGGDGIALVRERLPDIAFVDIGMPDLDGHAVARALKSDPSIRQAVLVALTGWGTSQDRARAGEAGFDFHLTKPASPESVQQILASVQSSRGDGRDGEVVAALGRPV